MNIYINKRSGGYSGGLAVVAARSEAEAHGVLLQQDDYYNVVYSALTWEKLENAYADVETPQVLAEDGHTE